MAVVRIWAWPSAALGGREMCCLSFSEDVMGALIKLSNELESTWFGVSLSTQGTLLEGSGQSTTGFSWGPVLICIPHPRVPIRH